MPREADSAQSERTDWDFETALREAVMSGDALAIQCAYLLGLWDDGLGEDECTQAEDGEEPCGACYFCQTRAAAKVEQEWWDKRRAEEARDAA